MNKCICKFYEPDMDALQEAEAMEAAYLASMSDAEREALEIWANEQPEDVPDPFANCGPCCKYSKSGHGYPGEYVCHCDASGNEHILHVDFIESEIL